MTDCQNISNNSGDARRLHEKFTGDLSFARQLAREYFERFPKNRYETEVESWRQIRSHNIEFTMRRLLEPKAP